MTLPLTVPDLVDPVLAGSRMPVAVSDPTQPDNPLIFVNPAFEKLTGYDAGRLVGRNCRFLQGPDAHPAARRVGAALASGAPVVETLLNYRPDGSAFYNLISVVPVRGWLGEQTYFVATACDVTERLFSSPRR